MKKYFFNKPLIEGLVKSRPNRFIMFVEIRNKLEKCHCPSTDQIASISFNGIPCLVSETDTIRTEKQDSQLKPSLLTEKISKIKTG